ncbi:MAG: hypothetical protein KGD67_00215 [Candidatus Lokiarchaeota archaeon]|nr:hypothetical protein [Candidatus Lokiarchaeota archaeon]
MNKINVVDNITSSIVKYLRTKIKDDIISIFGIGSYFDKKLPSDWANTDIDVVVIVFNLDKITKLNWTDVRYEVKKFDNHNVWIGYNTIQGLKNKEIFVKESFANYEWSLMDLKFKENSQLLYGKDIRQQIPDPLNFDLDFNDILARCLYHLDKSLKESKIRVDSAQAMTEFTKVVFKFGFYLCLFFSKKYYLTSVHSVSLQLDELLLDKDISNSMLSFMNESTNYRRTNKFSKKFEVLRKNFVLFTLSLLRSGILHKKYEFQELLIFLNNKFNGMPYLISYLKKAKNVFYSTKKN